MGLTNTQFDTIMRDYERQQNRNRQELSDREAEIYRRFPQFSEIDAQIARAGTACARRLLGEGDSSFPRKNSSGAGRRESSARGGYADKESRERLFAQEQDGPEEPDEKRAESAEIALLRRKIAGLSARKAEILREAGYPADYLEMHYRCADCRDTGYIGQQKCHCFLQASIDLLYAQSNLRESLQEETFENFSLKYYPEELKDPSTGLTAAQTAKHALEECKRFVREFDQSFGNLFLYGDTGLGKTFLSRCIARELLDTAHSVIYFSAFRLFELFADSAFGRAQEAEAGELERHIFDCDFLIIDDLGTELVNSFVSSQLFLIVNERILRRKSTLISTNLSLATFMDTYSERVFSRISSNYRILKLIGDDIRLQKKFEKRQSGR